MVVSALVRKLSVAVMEPTIATMMLIVNTVHKSSEKEMARKKGRMGQGGTKKGGEDETGRGEEGGEDGTGRGKERGEDGRGRMR